MKKNTYKYQAEWGAAMSCQLIMYKLYILNSLWHEGNTAWKYASMPRQHQRPLQAQKSSREDSSWAGDVYMGLHGGGERDRNR